MLSVPFQDVFAAGPFAGRGSILLKGNAAAGVFLLTESKALFRCPFLKSLLYALLPDPNPFPFFSPCAVLSKQGRAYSVSRQFRRTDVDR